MIKIYTNILGRKCIELLGRDRSFYEAYIIQGQAYNSMSHGHQQLANACKHKVSRKTPNRRIKYSEKERGRYGNILHYIIRVESLH